MKSGRHICVVTETYAPEINGVALTLSHLVAGLRLQGHSVSVVRPRQRGHDSRWGDEDERLRLVDALPLPGYKGLQIGVPAGATLRRRWTGDRPDVVYVATEGPLGWSAVRAARRLGIPVFSGFHTNFHCYSRHYSIGCLRRLILGYLWWFHNQTAGTIVASADLRNQLSSIGVRNIGVLGRGVDSQLFTPARRCIAQRSLWRADNDTLVMLYVGRVAAEKNLDLAIESYRAMQRLRRPVRFVIVGDGPIRQVMQRRHPDLIFSGVLTGEALARAYASSDVFLFPSETETFGNVTLEAMASGLVVIAYDYAAAHLHIKDGRTGLLVRAGEARGFISAAAAVASDVHELGAIGRRARDYAVSLDWPSVADRFAALLLGGSGERAERRLLEAC